MVIVIMFYVNQIFIFIIYYKMEDKRIVVYRKKMFCFDMVSSEIYEWPLSKIENTYYWYKILSIVRFQENS